MKSPSAPDLVSRPPHLIGLIGDPETRERAEGGAVHFSMHPDSFYPVHIEKSIQVVFILYFKKLSGFVYIVLILTDLYKKNYAK